MPVIAAISPIAFTNFGDLLRYLRRRARLQQRNLAIAVGYSESQICRLEQNQRLPDLTMLAALFVPALNLEDEPELAGKLLELAAAARVVASDRSATPYPNAAAVKTRAPARTHTPPNNLPAPFTPLVDRTHDLAVASDSLRRADVRLLTLVGPPGIGKSRLSLRVAADLADQFADGVFFVALAPIRDPALVLPTIAHVLGVKAPAGQPLIETMRDALHDRQMLLLLDNFEHVLAAATHVADLLRAAPRLKVLATSRAALHLSGEHLFVIPPLGLPDSRALPPPDELARYPAVQLFVTRVQAINPDFRLDADNARAIAEICVALDGLPLALELAAARSRLFSPHALLDRLRGATGPTTLQFLVGGPRDLLMHQQTLRSTLDWSYDLLDQRERRLLMHTSLFVGGCTADAIAAVCGETTIDQATLSSDQFQTSIMEGLLALADKSLLRCDADADAQPRFSMLETIREYAREKLDAEQDDSVRRYIEYYLALARAAERELNGAQQKRWFRRLELEYDNIRTVLALLAERNAADGLRLVTSLRQFWLTRGYLNEGRWWLESLLHDARAIGIAAAVRARALCVAGYLAYQQGDLLRAKALSQASLALSRPLGDQRCVVDALLNLGGVAYYHNEYAHASQLYAECLTLYRKLGAPAEVALALKNLGLIAKDQGDFTRANGFFAESMAICHEFGDKRGVAQALFSLAVVAYWQGDYTRAVDLSKQCVASCRDLGDQMGAAYGLETLGMAAYKQADLAQAAGWLEASLGIMRELGDQGGVALLLSDLGVVVQTLGNRTRAVELHAEALAISWKMGDKRRVAFCLEGLAIAFKPARFLEAAQLLGTADALREAIGAPLPPAEHAGYQRSIDTIKAHCGDEQAFVAAWATGRVMSVDQVIALGHWR